MAIVLLSAQGDEQLAEAIGAAVGGHADRGLATGDHLAAGDARDRRRREPGSAAGTRAPATLGGVEAVRGVDGTLAIHRCNHPASLAASARAASSRSSNGTTLSLNTW